MWITVSYTFTSGLQTAPKTDAFTTKNVNLRVIFLLRSPLATIQIYMLWFKNLHVMPFLFFSCLFCNQIFYVEWDDAHQSFSGKKNLSNSRHLCRTPAVTAHLLNAAPAVAAWERSKMTKTCEVKAQKSSVYFMHLNKPQQVKLTAVWTLAISLTILVYNRY